MEKGLKKAKFDIEWVKLILEAKNIGLTIEDVRLFFMKVKEDS